MYYLYDNCRYRYLLLYEPSNNQRIIFMCFLCWIKNSEFWKNSLFSADLIIHPYLHSTAVVRGIALSSLLSCRLLANLNSRGLSVAPTWPACADPEAEASTGQFTRVWSSGRVLRGRATRSIGFRSRFSQCVHYMRFNEKSFCFRWQETTKLMLFCNTKTSSLVILCDLRYLTGNISSVMTKHMGVQRKLHRFAYLIVQIILCFYS